MLGARAFGVVGSVALAGALLSGCASGDHSSVPVPEGWPSELVPPPVGVAELVDGECQSADATSGGCIAIWSYSREGDADVAVQRLGVALGTTDWVRQDADEQPFEVYLLEDRKGRDAGYAFQSDSGLLAAQIGWGPTPRD